jgi:hypothetical protein
VGRNLFLLEPQKRERLVPQRYVMGILHQDAAPFPIVKPDIGGNFDFAFVRFTGAQLCGQRVARYRLPGEIHAPALRRAVERAMYRTMPPSTRM